jgi:hypothetical protein
MTNSEFFKHLTACLPQADPKLTEFPSGAMMLDITIRGVRYCAEYLPSHNKYALSKTDGTSPFWEGVEQVFSSAEELKISVMELYKG